MIDNPKDFVSFAKVCKSFAKACHELQKKRLANLKE